MFKNKNLNDSKESGKSEIIFECHIPEVSSILPLLIQPEENILDNLVKKIQIKSYRIADAVRGRLNKGQRKNSKLHKHYSLFFVKRILELLEDIHADDSFLAIEQRLNYLRNPKIIPHLIALVSFSKKIYIVEEDTAPQGERLEDLMSQCNNYNLICKVSKEKGSEFWVYLPHHDRKISIVNIHNLTSIQLSKQVLKKSNLYDNLNDLFSGHTSKNVIKEITVSVETRVKLDDAVKIACANKSISTQGSENFNSLLLAIAVFYLLEKHECTISLFKPDLEKALNDFEKLKKIKVTGDCDTKDKTQKRFATRASYHGMSAAGHFTYPDRMSVRTTQTSRNVEYLSPKELLEGCTRIQILNRVDEEIRRQIQGTIFLEPTEQGEFRVYYSTPDTSNHLLARTDSDIIKTRMKNMTTVIQDQNPLQFNQIKLLCRDSPRLATEFFNELSKSVKEINHSSIYPMVRHAITRNISARQFSPVQALNIVAYARKNKEQILRVADPCGGWGERLVAFMADPNIIDIWYNDVNDKLSQGYTGIVATFHNRTKVKKNINLSFFPFEELPNEKLKREANSRDLVLTSPPYFSLEKYHHEKSSFRRYPDQRVWIMEFLSRIILNSYILLRAGGFMVFCVANIRQRNNNLFEIVEHTKYFMQLYCENIDTILYGKEKRIDKIKSVRGTEEVILIGKVRPKVSPFMLTNPALESYIKGEPEGQKPKIKESSNVEAINELAQNRHFIIRVLVASAQASSQSAGVLLKQTKTTDHSSASNFFAHSKNPLRVTKQFEKPIKKSRASLEFTKKKAFNDVYLELLDNSKEKLYFEASTVITRDIGLICRIPAFIRKLLLESVSFSVDNIKSMYDILNQASCVVPNDMLPNGTTKRRWKLTINFILVNPALVPMVQKNREVFKIILQTLGGDMKKFEETFSSPVQPSVPVKLCK